MKAAARPVFFLSIDVETWVHGRLGTEGALWPDAAAGHRAVYGAEGPPPAFAREMEITLESLAGLGVPATFFWLSEMAQAFPGLVRACLAAGHEIALHGENHQRNSLFPPEEFRALLRRARSRLEDIAGTAVSGYRAPFLIIDSRQLAIVEEEGFIYDSSICPSRKVIGKFGNMAGAPELPYHPDRSDLAERGDMRLVELPLAVFPAVRLPASTGIMTRVAGGWWTRLGVGRTLRRGYGCFYFHPYEIAGSPGLPRDNLYFRLFYRNVGKPFRRFLESYVESLKPGAEFLTGKAVAERFRRA